MSSSAVSPPLQNTQRAELMTRLFSALQVARFNELYYQRRAAQLRLRAKLANIVSALSASAVLANLLATNNQLFGWGPAVWQILTGLAAVSATAGPFLGLDSNAAQMEKAALGHSIIKDRTMRLLSDLKLVDLDDVHLGREQEIESFRAALTPLDEPPSNRLRDKCWDQTLEEFPSDKAWSII